MYYMTDSTKTVQPEDPTFKKSENKFGAKNYLEKKNRMGHVCVASTKSANFSRRAICDSEFKCKYLSRYPFDTEYVS